MGVFDARRLEDMRDAVDKGDAGPQRKNLHGDHEAPEIDFAAITKRVAVVGRPFRPVHAVEQQHGIAAIDERMNGFAPHRGTAGDHRGANLDRRDDQVSGDRCIEYPACGVRSDGAGRHERSFGAATEAGEWDHTADDGGRDSLGNYSGGPDSFPSVGPWRDFLNASASP